MKKYICLIASLLNTVATGIYIYFIDNDTVPIHFDVNGKADIQGSKWTLMFIPCILILMSVVYLVIDRATKNKENYQKNNKYQNILFIALFLLMLIMFWVLLVVSVKSNGEIVSNIVPFICSIFLGLIGIVCSNYMPKFKTNKIWGIKNSATLNNEYVWKMTHRFAGKAGMIGSFAVIFLGFISVFVGDFSAVVFILGIVVFVVSFAVLPTIYSYKLKGNVNKQ